MEEQTILSALEEWNAKTAAAKFPDPAFVYQGRLVDQYGEHAFKDERSVIYRAFAMPDIEGTQDSDYGVQVGGSGGDVLVNVTNVWPAIGYGAQPDDKIYSEPYSFPPEMDDWGKNNIWEHYRRRLKIVTLHELGHLVGIEHTDGRRSRGIMNGGYSDRYNELQPADIEAFCHLHGC